MAYKGDNGSSQMIVGEYVGEYIGVFDYAGITYLVARVGISDNSEMSGKFVVRAASDVFPNEDGKVVIKSDVSSAKNSEDLSKFFEEALNSDDKLQIATEAQDVLDACNKKIRKLVEGKQVYFGYNYGLTDDLTKQKKMSRGGVLDGSGIDDTSQITAGEYIGVFDYASITYLVARVSESEDSKMLGKFVVRAASIDVFPHVGGEIVLKGDTSSSENFEDLSECFEGKLNSDEWQNVETFQDVLRVCEATVSIHDAYYTYIVGNAKMLTATSFPWNRFEAMKKNFRSFAESRREGSTIVDPKTIFGAPKCLKRELSMPLAQLYFK